jgi:hypothetical protein
VDRGLSAILGVKNERGMKKYADHRQWEGVCGAEVSSET